MMVQYTNFHILVSTCIISLFSSVEYRVNCAVQTSRCARVVYVLPSFDTSIFIFIYFDLLRSDIQKQHHCIETIILRIHVLIQ